MRRYIGLDAHAASCTLAIVAETGKRLRDFPVETNGAALVEAIRAIPSPRHLIFGATVSYGQKRTSSKRGPRSRGRLKQPDNQELCKLFLAPQRVRVAPRAHLDNVGVCGNGLPSLRW